MILKNCRLIPALSSGIEADHGSVIVEDGVIKDVIIDGQGTDLPDGETFECQGKTLLPGLIDAHTHIAGLRGYSADQLKNPMRFFSQVCNQTKRYLDYGFTTIRDCGTPLRVANHVRDAYESGLCIGPRVIACGLILSPTEIEEADGMYDLYAWIDSADQARRAARKELAEHADFIKVMASGSALHKQGIPVQPIITRGELEALVEIADLKGSYVTAHAHGDGAIRLCIETGVKTIEHASFISDKTVELLAQKENCYLIPTVSAMYQNPETTAEDFMFLVKKLQKMLDLSSQCLEKAYASGLKMGFGTDSCPGMDQYEEGIEFRFRSELCYMSNVDILLQATKYNAEILGLSHITGEIRAGLAADLILVNGNPDEDISVMYQKPAHVFLGGKQIK